MMKDVKILWADDEIDLLKPHIMFLEKKGYIVDGVVSGDEAIDLVRENVYDLVFLDENMPGLTGLETLERIKEIKPMLPIIMVTKSEEEFVMNDAIGNQIADYLIKPVNPNQLWLSIKKIVDNKRLVNQTVMQAYQKKFGNLSIKITEDLNFEDWQKVYDELVYWELKLSKSNEEGMKEVLLTQKHEANVNFSKFIKREYIDWIQGNTEAPLLSHKIIEKKVFPILGYDKPVYFVLLDNLRLDQWKILRPMFAEIFKIKEDQTYYSILPTATQYSRNAIFAGMMPAEIQETYPDKWFDDESEEGKNLYERFFLKHFLRQYGHNDIKLNYFKSTTLEHGKKLVENIHSFGGYDLNVIVYNFIDTLSHARTEMDIIKELADDEAAYRSITKSWFEHSYLYEALKEIARTKAHIVLTTDHGSIRVRKPSKVVGDKKTSSNLRYKTGKNVKCRKSDVFRVKKPLDIGLPTPHVSSSFIFAKDDYFLVYQNKYNYYTNLFKNTFQHGGISLEEMIIPTIVMETKV